MGSAQEGYALVISADGVKVFAAASAGRLYGAFTLSQLLRQFGRRLPGMRIGDAPKLAHRGVQFNFAQGRTAYRRDYMHYVVPQLARWKINAIYLYLETFFQFPSLTAGKGASRALRRAGRDERRGRPRPSGSLPRL